MALTASTKAGSEHCQGLKQNLQIPRNIPGELVADKLLVPVSAHQYFIEGLLHNMSDGNFGKSDGEAFVVATNWVPEAD